MKPRLRTDYNSNTKGTEKLQIQEYRASNEL